jgi:hypothetical protein
MIFCCTPVFSRKANQRKRNGALVAVIDLFIWKTYRHSFLSKEQCPWMDTHLYFPHTKVSHSGFKISCSEVAFLSGSSFTTGIIFSTVHMVWNNNNVAGTLVV